MQHVIRYVDDPDAAHPKDLALEYARSFDVALNLAESRRKLLEAHGPNAGVIIEDLNGQRLFVGRPNSRQYKHRDKPYPK